MTHKEGRHHSDKLLNVLYEIYNELFKQAEPSADFDKMRESGEAKKPNFFMYYYLSNSRQNKIMGDICRKHHLNRFERDAVKGEANLGCSPNSCERTWKDYRRKL